MARIKTFEQPHSHDAEWYKDRELADHINQGDHRPRLMQVLEYLKDIVHPHDSICDFGCGNGGLIREIRKEMPNTIWGYDLQPSNVEDAKEKNTPVFYSDFINEDCNYPDIAICTEVLEHLVDPDAFLQKLKLNGVRVIIASSPDYETADFHAPFHLWVFTENSYKEMFEQNGWIVDVHHKDHFQFVVAHNE